MYVYCELYSCSCYILYGGRYFYTELSVYCKYTQNIHLLTHIPTYHWARLGRSRVL